MSDTMKHHIDSQTQKTLKTFDHHAYEVIYASDNAAAPDKTEVFVARNIPHLIFALDQEKHPIIGRIKSIKELAYAPTVYVLMSRTRGAEMLHKQSGGYE